MKRIFLSAPGLICCAGQNRDELYDSCLKGNRNGFVIQELPGGKKFPTGKIPGELASCQNFSLGPAALEQTAIGPAVYIDNTRIIRIIDAALEQIRPEIEEAISVYGPERIGICLGSCDNSSEGSLLSHKAFIANGAFPEDYSLRFQSASLPVEFISRKFGLSGPALTIATACASGASAIAKGAELIKTGYCDAVIAGGADIVSETVLLGFHALEALSDSPTNPFSKNRKGINLGEGAAFFLLDSRENGGIELLGVGESADAFHMTAPGPDGAGPANAMKAALLDAGIESRQIGYVNLHGTGTELNDKTEAMAMKAVFGENPPPASATKPITGHTLGAAGALETAICWMVLKKQEGFPLHCWDGESDEELVFHPSVPNCGTTAICQNNNFAFGGCNVSLILGNRGFR
jgi:3-oxoacyl-[acyl-carrier-protein] synthase-1